jgi:hypothetical protein
MRLRRLPPGGTADGPAKPVPWRLLSNAVAIHVSRVSHDTADPLI